MPHHDWCTCATCRAVRQRIPHHLRHVADRYDSHGRATHTSRGRLTCVGCDATPGDGDLLAGETHERGCIVRQVLDVADRRAARLRGNDAQAAPHLRGLPGPAGPHQLEVPWPALRAV